MAWLKYAIILITACSLTACMVGPDFHSPAPPTTHRYNKTPLPKKTTSVKNAGKAGKAQQFNIGQTIPADWWALYHSVPLNKLIITGLANSPNLAAAKATLVQAQENYNAQVGNLLFPAVNLQLSPQRQNSGGSTTSGSSTTGGSTTSTLPSSVFSLYTATVNVTYTLDAFGASRRQIEAALSQVDNEYYQLQGAYLTLTSNIVTTAIAVASLQAQIVATKGLIQDNARQYVILKKQFELGGVAQSDVLLQQTLLEQTRSLLPPLQKNLAQSQHLLSILIGSMPSESHLPDIQLDALTLPAQLPVSLPSSLVRQRPDIQASEALLHQASAQVGVATANLYPQISLNASYGYAATAPAQLFRASSNIWGYGGQLLQPIFHGGALRAQKRAAIAAYDTAFAQYRETVLQAFKNVADVLRALDEDAKELKAQKRAEAASRATLDITREQFKLGAVTFINVLNAEQQYRQIVIQLIQAQTARYADTAALFQALGGGWWNGAVTQ